MPACRFLAVATQGTAVKKKKKGLQNRCDCPNRSCDLKDIRSDTTMYAPLAHAKFKKIKKILWQLQKFNFKFDLKNNGPPSQSLS